MILLSHLNFCPFDNNKFENICLKTTRIVREIKLAARRALIQPANLLTFGDKLIKRVERKAPRHECHNYKTSCLCVSAYKAKQDCCE